MLPTWSRQAACGQASRFRPVRPVSGRVGDPAPGHRSCPPSCTPQAAAASSSPSPPALVRSLQVRCDDCPGPRDAVRAARAATEEGQACSSCASPGWVSCAALIVAESGQRCSQRRHFLCLERLSETASITPRRRVVRVPKRRSPSQGDE